MSSQSVGVEIGQESLRVARVQTSAKGIQVQQVAEASFPDGATLTSLNASSLSDEVAAALEPRVFAGRDVVVVVDHPTVVLSAFRLAAGFTDELSSSIKWYAEQYMPYPVDTAVVDFQVQDSPYGGQKTVMLVSIQRSVVNKIMELLPPKRLKLRRIDAVPFSLHRLYGAVVAVDGDPADPAVVVHASDSSGYVLVASGGQVRAVRHVRVDEESGVPLAEKVQQTCRHYEFHHPTEHIQAAYATLRTLAAEGAGERLGDELGLEVRALDVASIATLAGRGDAAGPDGGWAETFSLAVGAAI
jgi:Tfp pilus assembly PilM family ATPase